MYNWIRRYRRVVVAIIGVSILSLVAIDLVQGVA